MTDEQKEQTIFDALRDGSLVRRIFEKPAPAEEADEAPWVAPEALQPVETEAVETPAPEVHAPVAKKPFRLALQLAGGWLVLALVIAFGGGFIWGARWQQDQGNAAPPALPTQDLGPQKQALSLGGQTVVITHSALDIGSLPDAFDGNPDTLMRGAADNPFFVEIEFSEPRVLTGLDLTVATMAFFTVDVTLTYDDGTQEVLNGSYEDLPFDPTVSFTFPQLDKPVSVLRVEIEDIRERPIEGFHIHVRELVLR